MFIRYAEGFVAFVIPKWLVLNRLGQYSVGHTTRDESLEAKNGRYWKMWSTSDCWSAFGVLLSGDGNTALRRDSPSLLRYSCKGISVCGFGDCTKLKGRLSTHNFENLIVENREEFCHFVRSGKHAFSENSGVYEHDFLHRLLVRVPLQVVPWYWKPAQSGWEGMQRYLWCL